MIGALRARRKEKLLKTALRSSYQRLKRTVQKQTSRLKQLLRISRRKPNKSKQRKRRKAVISRASLRQLLLKSQRAARKMPKPLARR